MTLAFKDWAEVEAVFSEAFDVPPALAAAARQGGDVQQAPGEAPQSGHEVATPNGGSMTITTVELLAEWERLENAFHDNLPCQGECGDQAHGKALCQFLYDNSDTFRTLISNLVKALEGLVAAVEMDANGEHGISGYTGARLSDAREALRSNLDKEEGDNGE